MAATRNINVRVDDGEEGEASCCEGHRRGARVIDELGAVRSAARWARERERTIGSHGMRACSIVLADAGQAELRSDRPERQALGIHGARSLGSMIGMASGHTGVVSGRLTGDDKGRCYLLAYRS